MDKNYIDKILNLRKINDEIFIYPQINVADAIYTTKKLSSSEVQILKKNI